VEQPGVKLSVVIPARNEAGSIQGTVAGVTAALREAEIDYEVLVVDDSSSDGTVAAVDALAKDDSAIRGLRSHYRNGFGFAVRAGLERFTGDAVAIVMGDGSDDPADLVTYYRLLEEGYDCAFGSRFLLDSKVHDYPKLKLALNRLANWGIRILFRHGYNDTTNAFKAYRREVIENVQPLLSNHFNLTVELPLKAFVRGHSYAVMPLSWTNRSFGESKLGIREMGSRYLFIILSVYLEHHLSRGDYRRPGYSETAKLSHVGFEARGHARDGNGEARPAARGWKR
jgi:dolichol-phosphate mannosyltransferase